MSGMAIPTVTSLFNGSPNAGGVAYVYQTATTTPITIYSNASLATPITNPVTLDVNGQATFYTSGAVNIRVDLYTPLSGSFIETVDPIYPVSGVGTSAGSVVYQGTNLTLSTTNSQNNIVATTGITISLPLSTGFSSSFQCQLNAQGGAITLIPQSSEFIQKGSAGASFVMLQGSSGELWTDAAGNWGINFLSIPVAAPVIPGSYIQGCALSNNVTTPNTKLNVAAGMCADSTNTVWMRSAGYTIDCTVNGANGLDTGTFTSNNLYKIFLISKADGTTAAIASAATPPTMPSGYIYYRRLGSTFTGGSAAFVLFTQTDDIFLLGTPFTEMDTTNPSSSAVTLTLTRVPNDVVVEAILTIGIYIAGGGTDGVFYISSLNQTDVAPFASKTATFTAPAASVVGTDGGSGASAKWVTTEVRTLTDGSAKIRTRSSTLGSTDHVGVITKGWRDFRGNT